MQQLLECLGHEVAVAADGPSGVELVLEQQAAGGARRHRPARPRRLPGGAASCARELGRPQLRLVAMTGFGQSSDRDQALAAGFDSHLIKPARTDQIQRALRGE